MKQRIELRHLDYFVHVAEELHFGRAAERLGMAQAPLSQQIRQLEDRLGATLLNRTTRHVSLTRAGELFLQHAKALLAQAETAIGDTRAASNSPLGRIVVGAVFVAQFRFLPPIISTFRRRYPRVEIDLVVMTTSELLGEVQSGRMNLAFIHPPAAPGALDIEIIAHEGFVALLRDDHRLAGQVPLRLADLADEDFVVQRAALGASYHHLVLEQCRAAGFRPRVVQETSSVANVAVLVAAGLGVAVVPGRAALMPLPNLVHRPLAELPHSIAIAVARAPGEVAPVVRHFIEVSRKVARELDGQL
ncbi:DNA-binding transcriptional regulator, LysR family [Rhizobiales bacterium GAS188]|nr:DNA-binding transcriptional regulator, LysR family [Rhizobiales bacterium GAS188]